MKFQFEYNPRIQAGFIVANEEFFRVLRIALSNTATRDGVRLIDEDSGIELSSRLAEVVPPPKSHRRPPRPRVSLAFTEEARAAHFRKANSKRLGEALLPGVPPSLPDAATAVWDPARTEQRRPNA